MPADPPQRRKRPVVLDLDETALPPAPAPAEAPPPPEPGETPAAEQALRRAARGGGSWLSRVFWGALGLIVGLAVWLAAVDFLVALEARAPWLGLAGEALLWVLAFLALVWALREAAGIARLRRLDGLRRLALSAAETDSVRPARKLVGQLRALYAERPDMETGLERLERRGAEAVDGPALVELAERALMPPLDAEAERAVARAAQRVAAITAFIPVPAIDVIAVLAQNAGMIRRIAEIYGGRAGWLGSVRLLRAVAQHLLATGAIAATDDMLGPLVGGGLLGSLSRRFGEATVNAALTARVGVAAIEVCRPLPFRTRPAPRTSGLVVSALRDWQRSEPPASNGGGGSGGGSGGGAGRR